MPGNRKIWDLGKNFADNHSWFRRIRHSKYADPFRRKSVTRVGKIAINVATSFIPIPVVKDLVTGAVKVGLAKAREKQIKMKKGSQANDDYTHSTKWGWKDLDVTMMDRYRWKIKHGVEVFNEAYKKASQNYGDSASVCNDWVKAVSKWCYLEKRIEKMQERVSILQELLSDSQKWLDDVKGNSAFDHNRDQLISIAHDIDQSPADGKHTDCDSTLCVHKTERRFFERNKTFVDGVSTLIAFSTNDVGFTATNTGIYDEKTYQESD